MRHRVPNKMDAKRPTPRHIIKMPKVKDKEGILKYARERQKVTNRGVPIRLSADFSKETLQARRDWQEIFSHETGTYSQDCSTSKAIIWNQRADKELPRQEKTKGVHHYQTVTI